MRQLVHYDHHRPDCPELAQLRFFDRVLHSCFSAHIHVRYVLFAIYPEVL